MVCPPLPTGRRRTGISNIRCAFPLRPPNGKIVPCGTENSRAERSRVFKVSCLLLKHCRRVRSLLRAKREPERTAVPAGHESPSGAFKPQTGLRSKCRVFSAARSLLLSRRGRHELGAARPSNPKAVGLHTKNLSRFAKGFFVFRRLEAPQSLRDSSLKEGASGETGKRYGLPGNFSVMPRALPLGELASPIGLD